MAAQTFRFEELAPKVVAALRGEFPTDTIDVTEGYQGRVHVLVVSSKFNDLSEHARQDLLWGILKAELAYEAQGVSFAIAYGTDELR